jgi:hypothetical protein
VGIALRPLRTMKLLREGLKDGEELSYLWRRSLLLQLHTTEKSVIHSRNTVPLGYICHIYLQFCPKQQRKINENCINRVIMWITYGVESIHIH